MMSDTNNQNSCPQKPCQPGQSGYPNTSSEDRNPNFSEKPVLYTGVLWIGVLRKFLIPRPVPDTRPCCPRREVSEVDKDVSPVTPTNTSSSGYIQPSPHTRHKPHEFRKQEQQLRGRNEQESKHSSLATLVHQIQEASAVLKDEARQFSEDLSELVQEGKTTTSEKLHTLREDEVAAGRYGAITITSLLGYMAGMRRSVAVRLVYAVTGAVATATLCYPEEALHYNNLALAYLREGVLFSVQLLRYGPQKTLVVEDSVEKEMPTSRKNQTITPESYSKPSQKLKTTSTTNDNVTHHEISVGGLEHKNNQNHLSSAYEQNKLQENNLFLEQHEKQPSEFAGHEGKLSKECRQQQNNSRAVPYSPALPVPVPPMVLDPDCFQNFHTYSSIQNSPKSSTDVSFNTNLQEKANLQPNCSQDSQSSIPVNPSHSKEHKTNELRNSNPTEINDVRPALGPIKEPVSDSPKNENHHKGQNYPLNKKLSRYYVEKKNDMFTSSKADDPYSKNN